MLTTGSGDPVLEEWKQLRIRDVTLRTKQRDPRRDPSKTFRYVDVSSVSNTLFKIVETAELEGAVAPSRARKEIRKDDVLFATVRPTLRRVALVPADLDGEIASTGFAVLRADSDTLDPCYLYYRLLTEVFIKRMGELERGASYPAIRESDVLSEFISVPPLTEQHNIAAVLGLVQQAIEQQERLIALTTELKKVLMHKLFTEGLRGEPQKQTEIGSVPESWEVVELGSLATSISKGSSPRWQGFEYVSGGILFVRSQNVGAGRMDFSDRVYLPPSFNEKEKRSVLKKNDILINLVGASIGRVALGTPEIEGANCNQAVGFVRLERERKYKAFIVYYLLSPMGQRQMLFQKKDIARANLSLLDLRSFKVPVPSREETMEIVEVFDEIETKIETCDRRKRALTDLFRTLLHQLMTAQVRVHDLDLDQILQQPIVENGAGTFQPLR